MQLAVDEINEVGGVNGSRLELLVVDNRTDPEEAKRLFAELEERHQPLLYVSTTSLISMALAPLAEEKQVVLMGLVVSNPVFTRERSWVFRYYVTASHELSPTLYILKKQQIRSLGVLYQDDPFGRSHFKLLNTACRAKDIAVTGTPFSPRSPDFSAISAAVDKNEAVYVTGFVQLVRQAISRLRTIGYPGLILTDSGASSLPPTLAELQGVYLTAPAVYNPHYAYARAAKERYEARYDKPFIHQAANGYDFINLLAGLLEGEELSRERVRELLEDEFNYPGLFGAIEKQQGSHDLIFPLFPARIVDHELHYLR